MLLKNYKAKEKEADNMSRRKLSSVNVSMVVDDQKHEKRLKDLAKNVIPKEELPYGSKLNMMGRQAYFEEYFSGVKLENQVFPKVGPFIDPTKTKSFNEGYIRGEVLVRTGVMTEERYNTENNTKNSIRR